MTNETAFRNALLRRDVAESEWEDADKALKAVPGLSSGPMGLTPDAVKATPEYKAAKMAYNLAFEKLRQWNQFINRHFKKEWRKVQKYEAGTNRISLTTAANIADVLGVSVLDLLPASDKRRKVETLVNQKTLVKIARLNSAIGKVLKDVGI